MGDRKIDYGDDGWPLEPDFYEEGRKQARERQFRKDMVRWKAEWGADDLTAAERAVRECIVRRVSDLGTDSDWLIDAVRKLTVSAMSEQEKRQRREWHIHQTRWEALVELRERGDELLAGEPFKPADPAVRAERRRSRRHYVPSSTGLPPTPCSEPSPGESRDDRGTNMERARAAVSKILKKTPARGTAAAVKASYEIVNEAGGKDATFESYKAVVRARRQKS
jgi:hypothetical protein